MNLISNSLKGKNRDIILGLYECGYDGVQPAKLPCLAAFNQFFRSVKKAFPAYQIEITSFVDRGDRVMVYYTISGKHDGEFMGMAPSGKPMAVRGLDVFRISNGRIVEHWDAARQFSALSTT